jgi:homoserine kinase type II
VTCEAGRFCLRRWPGGHPSQERLKLIHSVLEHSARRGFRKVPLPIATQSGTTLVNEGGHFWELEPWVSGRADFRQYPSNRRLAAAMQALAEFHLAVADHPACPDAAAGSPGLRERFEQLRRLAAGELETLNCTVRETPKVEFDGLAHNVLPLLSRAVALALECVAKNVEMPVRLQPAIRDIWHDHVFFEGDKVTGIVDFGALRVECVCGDIVRLLGSLVEDDARGWEVGLAAYESVRPLNDVERCLLPAFDSSTVVLSAVNWLRWIYAEGREFEQPDAVRHRLREIESRLRALCGDGGIQLA